MALIQTITRRLAVAVYFAIVLIPVVLFGHYGPWPGAQGFSVNEQRPFPRRISPGMFSHLDEWFAHRMGLRFTFMYVGIELNLGLLHHPLSQSVFFGRDDWLYWTDEHEVRPASMVDVRGRRRFAPRGVGIVETRLRAIREKMQSCGIAFAYLISPNKQSVYPEPLFVPGARFPETRVEALLPQLSEANRSAIVYPRATLRNARPKHEPVRLYPKTDTHWNPLGALYGYSDVMRALIRPWPSNNPLFLSLDTYEILSAPFIGGDIARSILFSPWRFPDEAVTLEVKGRKPPTTMTLRTGHSHVHNPEGRGRLVIFGGSFTEQLEPFFSYHFEEVFRYPSATVRGDVIARHRPDVVIQEVVERYSDWMQTPPIQLDKACER